MSVGVMKDYKLKLRNLTRSNRGYETSHSWNIPHHTKSMVSVISSQLGEHLCWSLVVYYNGEHES